MYFGIYNIGVFFYYENVYKVVQRVVKIIGRFRKPIEQFWSVLSSIVNFLVSSIIASKFVRGALRL